MPSLLNLTNRKRISAEIMLVLFPFLPFIAPLGTSVVYGIAVLVSLTIIFSKTSREQIDHNVKLIFISCTIFFLSTLITLNLGKFSDQSLTRLGLYAHLLFVIPFYYMWATLKPRQEVLWFGLALGAITAGIVAGFDVFILGEDRARGGQHWIFMGGLGLLMGVMAFFGQTHVRNDKVWIKLLFYFSLFAAIGASILSGSRGAWIAFPALLIAMGWYVYKAMNKKALLTLASIIIVGIFVFYAGNKQVIDKRLSLATTEVAKYEPGNPSGSVGQRLEMWRGAWTVFKENPIRGSGVGLYKNETEKLAASGKLSQTTVRWMDPHNDYLTALSERGIIGFSGLLPVYLVPLILFFYIAIRNNNNGFAFAGITLILLYMQLGLSTSLFTGTLPTQFFTFYLSILSYYSFKSPVQNLPPLKTS
jgi:O-antigen ligase